MYLMVWDFMVLFRWACCPRLAVREVNRVFSHRETRYICVGHWA